MLGTQYIRFRVVCRLTHYGPDKIYNCWNKWSNMFGCLSCLGMSLVANFQESSILSVHIFGAFLAFFLGTIYCMIHVRKYLNNLLLKKYTYSMIYYFSHEVLSSTLLSLKKNIDINCFLWSLYLLLKKIIVFDLTIIYFIVVAVYYIKIKFATLV